MPDSLTQQGDWYDLKQIEALTQIPYATLRRYAEQTEVRQAFGAERMAGGKGYRWPASSLAKWEQLADNIRAGTVTPGTASAYLQQQGHATSVALAHRDIDATTRPDAVAALRDLVDALRQYAPPPHEDALLTMKAAHEAYGIPYSVLRSLRVTVGNRRMVRKSDVLKWIQELKP